MSSRQLGGYFNDFSSGGWSSEGLAGLDHERELHPPFSLPSIEPFESDVAYDFVEEHPFHSSFGFKDFVEPWYDVEDGLGAPDASSIEASTCTPSFNFNSYSNTSTSSSTSQRFFTDLGFAPFLQTSTIHHQEYEEEVLKESFLVPLASSAAELNVLEARRFADSSAESLHDDAKCMDCDRIPLPPPIPARTISPLPLVPGHAIFDNEDPARPYGCPFPGCRQRYRFAFTCVPNLVLTSPCSRKADLKVHAQSKHPDAPQLAEVITPSRRSKVNKVRFQLRSPPSLPRPSSTAASTRTAPPATRANPTWNATSVRSTQRLIPEASSSTSTRRPPASARMVTSLAATSTVMLPSLL